MHLVEKVGSGIPRMLDLMLEAGLPEPVYETKGFFSVTFLRPKKEKVINEQNRIELTDIQKSILKMMEKDNKITFDEMIKKLTLSRDTLNRAINQLKKNNLIVREGSKKTGIWIVL
jgi:ATP-dependent DNA helicase RecG